MIVYKVSPYSGQIVFMEIDITEQQLEDFENDKLGFIQDAFPHIPAEQREFILTGILPSEWDELFPEDEEDF